ncbi:SMP-30/gluconolactonase/LRE family protein [Aquisediminimonas profunda]|uniref:SMP-30/gluconolactonase/LRE family protein n=1 Tax=Aquisediminimonas profunda TaxID=1550733 RepID=UPI001C629DAA|nr:SMP-30/gluconolactonase/LRE family protein [Aquisediminimonas profunda]
MDIRRLGDVRTILGEGPYWDVRDQVLFFVDIRGYRLWRYDPGTEQFSSWETPVQPSAITRTVDGGLLVALADGFYSFDEATGMFDLIAKVDFDCEKVQLNDAKVDRQGRFVAGATDKGAKAPLASVYSFDGLTVTELDAGYTICNGPCWSPDGKTFYLADTMPTNEIYAYDYDNITGKISNKRLFADCSSAGGYADGATIDADGRLWMAMTGGGILACFEADGTVRRTIETDVKWISSVQFGGPNLDKLYFTSFDAEAAAGYPPDSNSGYLYVVDGLDVKGLPEPLALTPQRQI